MGQPLWGARLAVPPEVKHGVPGDPAVPALGLRRREVYIAARTELVRTLTGASLPTADPHVHPADGRVKCDPSVQRSVFTNDGRVTFCYVCPRGWAWETAC